MDQTPNLSLPYILAAQAQKHVTHNEALRILDGVVQLGVRDRSASAPPATPGDGDRYIVAAGGTGAWVGRDNSIAAYQDGAWAFFRPAVGWVAWIADETKLVAWDGADWIDAGGSINPTALVGVNATADPTNRLSVNAPATLLNHEGGSHQLKVNKSAAGDTASLLFQSGFSGRAECGLTGDDDLRVKVSANGANWHDSIRIDRNSGEVDVRGRINLSRTGEPGRWRLGNDQRGDFVLGRDAPTSADTFTIDKTNLNVRFANPPRLPSYTVATLPDAARFRCRLAPVCQQRARRSKRGVLRRQQLAPPERHRTRQLTVLTTRLPPKVIRER